MDEKYTRYSIYDTAIGDVTILADEKALVGLLFGAVDPEGCYNEENAVLYDAIIQLNQYCYGQRKSLEVRLHPPGDSFDRQVFDYVRTIPYGKKMTYEEVAKAIDEPGAGPEVKEVLSRNPIPFFIPCHRVVGENGDIGTYVGGPELKERILKMEEINVGREFHPGTATE